MNPEYHCNITLQSSGLSPPLQMYHSPFGRDSQQIPTCSVKITLDPVTAKLILTTLLQGLVAQTEAELENFSGHFTPILGSALPFPCQPSPVCGSRRNRLPPGRFCCVFSALNCASECAISLLCYSCRAST